MAVPDNHNLFPSSIKRGLTTRHQTFHAAPARKAGASRQDVLSAILVGLPAAGQGVIQSLPAAMEAFEGS